MSSVISRYAVSIFLALQSKHVYMGTVSYAEKMKRRAKNKVAKISRRRNR